MSQNNPSNLNTSAVNDSATNQVVDDYRRDREHIQADNSTHIHQSAPAQPQQRHVLRGQSQFRHVRPGPHGQRTADTSDLLNKCELLKTQQKHLRSTVKTQKA